MAHLLQCKWRYSWNDKSNAFICSLAMTSGPRSSSYRAKFSALNSGTGDELQMHEWVFPTSPRTIDKVTAVGYLLRSNFKHLCRVDVPTNLLRPRGFTLDMEWRKKKLLFSPIGWCLSEMSNRGNLGLLLVGGLLLSHFDRFIKRSAQTQALAHSMSTSKLFRHSPFLLLCWNTSDFSFHRIRWMSVIKYQIRGVEGGVLGGRCSHLSPHALWRQSDFCVPTRRPIEVKWRELVLLSACVCALFTLEKSTPFFQVRVSHAFTPGWSESRNYTRGGPGEFLLYSFN